MRFLLSLLIASVAAIPTTASANDITQRPNPLKTEKKCANATSQFAGPGSVYRGDPAKPKKLTELPPAETYAAVYRVVDGCAVPVLYREVRAVRPPKR